MSIETSIAQLRDELLGRKAATEKEIAQALGRSRRAVQRMNLPFVRIGRTRFYDVPGARQVLTASPEVDREGD
jgi:hypothetical protein